MTQRKPILILLAACATAALLAGAAEAGKRAKLTTVSANVDVGPNFETTSSKCKRKSGAISVGFSTPSSDPTGGGGPNVLTVESRRSGQRKSLTTGYDSADSGQGKLSTHANCIKPKLKLTTVQRDLELTAAFGSVTAVCPRKTSVVSGGFRAGTGDVLLQPFTSMRRGKRKWTAAAVNPVAGFASDTLSVYAYCAKDAPKIKTSSESTTLQPQELGTLRPTCRKGWKAIAGGFESSAETLDFATTSVSRRLKSAWRISAFGNGDDASSLSAFAYCAKA